MKLARRVHDLCTNTTYMVLTFHTEICSVKIDSHTVQYSTVQYSTVQYSTVQYSTVQYSTVQYSTVQYSTVQYSTVQYSTVQYSTVQYSTVQYSTVQYSTVQYSTVQYSTVQYSTVVTRKISCLLSYLQYKRTVHALPRFNSFFSKQTKILNITHVSSRKTKSLFKRIQHCWTNIIQQCYYNRYDCFSFKSFFLFWLDKLYSNSKPSLDKNI